MAYGVPPPMSLGHSGLAMLRAAHPGPTFAVTSLAAAFAVSADLSAGRVVLVASAVLAGQLSIGWCNDLVDADRDRAVGRSDKPVASGEVDVRHVRVACAAAVLLTVGLSLACGLVAGLIHLLCVAAGWAYDLGVKATVWSWLPYAVAFGGLPVFITLSDPGAGVPPLWVAAAAALLGVGAHLVNVLPDLDDDEATGVRGLGHRLGPRLTQVAAVAILTAATGVMVLGISAVPSGVLLAALLLVAGLACLALFASGRVPFRAAIGIAAVDVLMLVVSG